MTRMNLGSGGQQALLRDTIINGKKQMMVFPDDYHDEALRGKAKGMKKILEERGLWQEGLLKTCTMCNTNAGNRNMNAGNQNMNADNCSNTCCAQRILELQLDFKAQKSLLEEICNGITVSVCHGALLRSYQVTGTQCQTTGSITQSVTQSAHAV